ncbi:DUF7507 domain-containing protein [Pedobacter sp. 22163]|uniref:DUF7507 domain-containing protein n=1 Tax=Pedobacter sp. 22163 TaxID=3453883 RepID=UPI003F87F707
MQRFLFKIMPFGKISSLVLFLLVLGISHASAQFNVTGLFTDYKGYWSSKQGAINPVWPDNKNNLLGFTFNNINYSTGVNDALLTSKLVSFTPGTYQAFPVRNIPLPGTASNFIGLGQLEDGVDNGGVYPYSVPVTVAQILTRGVRGLDMGSCITNIPATAAPLSFNFGAITDDSQIGDGIPDILITQVAQATGALDQVYFEDGNGNLVGNKISIDQSAIPAIGTWLPDFYDPNTGVIQPGFIKTERPIRIWAADASAFGITSANYLQPLVLRYKLGGSSDPAFIAFNTKFINLVTANDDQAATTLNTPINFDILANDQPHDQSALYSYTVPTTSAHGTIVKNADGTVTYIPNAGYYGQDSFTYTICTNINGTITCDDAVVTINISPNVIAPVFSAGVDLRCQRTGTSSYTASSGFATSMAFAISPNNAGTVSASPMTTSANVGTATATVTWAADYSGSATITAIAYGSNGPKSTAYNVTVNQAPTLVVSSNANQTICAGSSIASTTFTWGGSATDVTITNLPAGLSVIKSGKILTVSGTPTSSGSYTVSTTGQASPCGAANATGTININPIATLVSGGGDVNQVTCANGAITPITYTWSGSATDVNYTTLPAGLIASKNTTTKVLTISGTPTSGGTYSVSTAGQITPCTAVTITSQITVNPSAGLVAGGGSSNQIICVGSSIIPITYTWSGSATDVVVNNLPSGLVTSKSVKTLTISGIPTSGGTFDVSTIGQTVPCLPVSLNGSVTITATPAPTASNQNFCEISNATVANLVATGTGIKWYTQAMGGTALASTTALTNGTYYASQTLNGCESVTRASITVAITATPAPTASNQNFCEISTATVANLTATGTGVKWYTQATGGTALASTTALTNGTYYASQTLNGCESATRAQITVSITATPAPTASNQNFCEISTATVANLAAAGTSVKWYTQATGGTALASTAALANGTYYASQTLNGCESATRAQITVAITATPAPTASNQNFCEISNATVASLAATGTSVKWYSQATGGSALASTTALANGTYYASQTLNGCESATRAQITVSITATPAPTASNQTFCEISNATVANLTATGTGVKWYSQSSGGTALASTTALANGTYYASQTLNGCESATRAQITVSITATPAPTASNQNFCEISNATVASLAAAGTSVKWYTQATGGTALASTAALVNGTYYASQTLNGCESATRASITVAITATPAPTASNQTFCEISNATVANLTATGTGVKWYTQATGGTALASTAALANGTYYASQTLNGCESATRASITVAITATPAPTASNQNFCEISTATVANLAAAGASVKWYSQSSGGTALASTTALANGTYYASQTLNGCESATRASITVSITVTPAPTASNQTFCEISNATVANLAAAGTGVKWYTQAMGGTALAPTTALTNGTYYASQTLNGCESATRASITVAITATPAPTASNQNFCEISTATVANLAATGTGIKWYSQATGGTALASTAALTNGTYYASQTLNGCESATRASITVAITATPAPTASNQNFCEISSATVANLAAAGTSVKWYTQATGGTALASTAALANGTYYASQTLNGCESATRAQITVSITATLAPTASNQNFCEISNATVANLAAAGTSVKWYTQATGGTALASTTALTNGTYYASQTLNGCESATRAQITVTINQTPKGFNDTRTLDFAGSFSYDIQTLNINNTANGGNSVPASFIWTVNSTLNVLGAANGTGNTITQTLINTTNSIQTIVYTVTPKATVTGGCVGNSFTVTVSVPVCSSISITKSADVSSVNKAGNVINYTITVANTGNANQNNITISDPLLGGNLSNPAKTGNTDNILEKGETWTYNGSYTVLQSDLNNNGNPINNTGKIVNTASVNSTELPIAKTAAADVNIVLNPAVTLVKTGTLNLNGNSVSYLFTVKNTGNITLNNLVITDSKVTGSITLAATTLAPGMSTTATASYAISAAEKSAGSVSNTATVNGKDPLNGNVSDISGTAEGNNTPTVTNTGVYALDDEGTLNAVNGGVAVTNVLANDKLNGSQATLTNVTISPISSSNPNISIDPATGKVNVLPGTPVGSYTLVYQIEDKANPGNVKQATVTIHLIAGALLAKDDAGTANSITGGTAVANVLSNDTYNGTMSAPTLNDVTITHGTNDSNGKVTLDPTTGAVNVAANTPAGVYTLTYTITDQLDASKTSTATVKVTVASGALLAKNDAGTSNSVTGGTAVANVLANDTYNGTTTAPTLADVTITNGTNDSNGKVTLDPTTGAVNVAANTPAGVYTLTYTITDQLDASKTSTATVKVTVASGALLAKNDAGTSNSVTGGTAVANVLANDTYNGTTTAPTLADVTITNGTNDSNGKVTLDLTTGTVNVAANTPAGVYTLTYTITDQLDASKTSTSTVKVTVASGALLAKDDAGNANGLIGGVAVNNVLSNDSYNGTSTAPTLNDVTLSQISTSNPNVILNVATGQVDVNANTPAGIYTIIYEIVDKLDANQTKQATVTITVGLPVLVATNDSGNANGFAGGTAVENVLINDTYNGNPATLNDVKLSQVSTSHPNVTLDVTTGKVNVAPNTPAGSYTLVYQIEDKLNPGQTKTATVTITVGTPALAATNDSGNANGFTGGTAVENVLINDTYNGNPATLNDVKLSQVSTSHPNVTLDVTTGKVNVAPNTPAGSYTLVYQIEDKLNPGQTKTATVTITVGTPALAAIADSGNANGFTGGTAVENVLINDTYNGNPATLNNVKLSQVSTTHPNVTLDVTTGKVNVAQNTPAGTYTLVYQIEDKLNPGQTKTATVTITVGTPALAAIADSGNANGFTGGTAVENVLNNDTYNGNPATLNNVKLSQVSTTHPNVTLDVTTGKVNVAQNTPAGTYTLVYQIEDKLNPGQTKTATVTITVGTPALAAIADSGNANGFTGGTAVENVLNNDTYNGNPATLNDVKLSQVSTGHPNVTLDVTTGKVNVAPNTPAGSYTLVYQIEDKLNPGQMTSATVTITIGSPVLVATNDSGNANGFTGGTAVENVLANDTYNGNPATLNDVKLSQVSTSHPNVTLDVTTGKVNVAPNTPAGSYTLVYQIEDKLNPGQTTSATVTITVGLPVLVATNDSGNANGFTGGTAVENVLDNDTYNGNPATLNDVKLSQVSTTHPNVILDVTTGQVNVAPNTPAGTYTLVYQIEDKLNPGQMTSATVTITIGSPVLVATNDSGNANGFTGGTAVENVLDNDTYNGNPATLNDVKLSQVSTTHPNVTLDVTTGKVNVAPNTPAGTYTLVYQIEDKLNPGQTKTATVTITVGTPALAAIADSGNANGFTGGTAVENVLDNDTYNGNPATLNDVKLSQVSTSHPNVTLDVTTGKVNVAPNTPAGSYTLVYQIEDKLNPGQTKTATVTIVGTPALAATNDSGNANGFTGGTAVENVLDNDTYNGNPATLNDVKLSQVSTTHPNVTLDVTTGKVNVAPNTPAGTYTLVYQIEDKLNLGQTKTATVTITVGTPALAAIADSGNANGFTGGTAVENVLDNDTYNSNPATLNEVKLSQVSTTNPNVTLDVTTGKVNVAAGTFPGVYALTYQISDKLDAAKTSTAVVTVNIPNWITDLQISKTANVTGVEKNGDISYTIIIKNNGPATVLSGEAIGLIENLPVGLENISYQATGGTYDSTAKTFTVNADLLAGQQVSLTVSGRVTTAFAGADLVNTVSLSPTAKSTDPDHTNNQSTVTTIILRGKITLVKTGALSADRNSITYTFNVINIGDVALSNIVLIDQKLALNKTFSTALAVGASFTFDQVYTLSQSDKDAGSVSNTASVSAKTPAGNTITDVSGTTSGNDNPTETPILNTSSLTFTKVAGAAGTKVGESIDYTFAITNTGSVTLSNLTVSDAAVDAGSIKPAVISTLAPGASINVSAKHTLTQNDINLGSFTNQASVKVTDNKGLVITQLSDDPATPALNDATVTQLTPSPGFTLTKSATNSATKAGDVINYNIIFKNTGNVTLTDIALVDANADAGSLTPSNITSVPPGATVNITAKHTVKQSDVNAGGFSNQVSANVKDPKGNTITKVSDDPSTPVVDDATFSPIVANPSLRFTKVFANAAGVVKVIEYSIQVTNTGNVTLTDIVVTDEGADAGSITPATIGKLEPAETAWILARHTLTQPEIDNGKFVNQAALVAKYSGANKLSKLSDDPRTLAPDDPTVFLIKETPGLTLVKTGVLSADGNAITYTFTVKNTGNVTLSNFRLLDPKLSSTLTFAPASIAPDQTAVATAVYAITQAEKNAGTVRNTATLTASTPAGTPVSDVSGTEEDNDYPTIIELPKIVSSKTVTDANNNGMAEANEVLTYSIMVKNNGNTARTGVKITDAIPANTTCISASADNGGALVGNVLNWNNLTIPANGQVRVSFKVMVNAIIPSGILSVNNTATVTDPGNALTPLSPAVSIPTAGMLEGSKSVADSKGNKDGKAQANEILTYSLQVKNTGGSALNGVTITDELPAGLTYVANSVSGYGTVMGNTLKWTINMRANSSTVLTFDAKVAPDVNNYNTVKNVAIMTGLAGPVIKPEALIAIDKSADLMVTKELVTKGDIKTGSDVTYKITVTNKGPNRATGVTVTDKLSTIIDAPKEITVPIGTTTYSTTSRDLVWLVGSLDLNQSATLTFKARTLAAGVLNNSATVKGDQPDPILNNNTVLADAASITGDDLLIPNLFTPNGDGINDTFEINGLAEFAENELTIINRWGNEVFRAKGYQNNWTGEGLNEGTYYYLLRARKGGSNEWKVFKGYITLIRAFKN